MFIDHRTPPKLLKGVKPLSIWPESYRKFFAQGFQLAADQRDPKPGELLRIPPKAQRFSDVFPQTHPVKATGVDKETGKITESTVVVADSVTLSRLYNIVLMTRSRLLGQLHAEWFVDHVNRIPREAGGLILFWGTRWNNPEETFPYFPVLKYLSQHEKPDLFLMNSCDALPLDMVVTIFAGLSPEDKEKGISDEQTLRAWEETLKSRVNADESAPPSS